jgi:hypothetical protein
MYLVIYANPIANENKRLHVIYKEHKANAA